MSSWHTDITGLQVTPRVPRRSNWLYSSLWTYVEQVCIHFHGTSSPCSRKPFTREPSSRLGEGVVGLLGRVSPHQLFPMERQSLFARKVNHLQKVRSVLHNLDVGFPSQWSHSSTAMSARIPENEGQLLPSAWAPQRCVVHRLPTATHRSVPAYTALLQLGCSPQRAASSRKIIKVPETYWGAFRVSCKASWNCPAAKWPLTFQAEPPRSTEELAQNKGTRKQVYGLTNLSKSKAMSFLVGLSQPDSILSTWAFLCWLFFIFFLLLVLKRRHIDRCFPHISILWCIKSCCWSSYKSFQGIISFVVTPGSSGNLRGESNVLL